MSILTLKGSLISKTGSEVRGRGVLLFKAKVAQVVSVDADDAVVFLEELLLLSLASHLQTLHQETPGPGDMTHVSARTHTHRKQTLDTDVNMVADDLCILKAKESKSAKEIK